MMPAVSSVPGRYLQVGFPASVNIDSLIRRGMLFLICLWLAVAVVLPLTALLSQSLFDRAGDFVGLKNFLRYFQTPALAGSLVHSLYVSSVTTVFSVVLGFVFAYGLTRTDIPGKTVLQGLVMVPLFAPTLLNGLALVYLFGKKGLITTGFFGLIENSLGLNLAWDIDLYGPAGIIMSEIIYTFPQAVLIISMALRLTDARLYEASESLGASKARTFFRVTLPGAKYGLISAALVCFILSFTDFGGPKVVGGNYNVLATDVYKQVIGQQNFAMGATVSVVLLTPTVLAFILDRLTQRRQAALIAAKSVPLVPRPDSRRDRFFFLFCALIVGLIIVFYATAAYASLVKVWPYQLRLTLAHYDFSRVGGGGYASFWNSLRMSLYSALAGTILTFLGAYLIEKTRGAAVIRQASYFLSMLPLALPGLVIGLSYIFFFNAPGWRLPWFDWMIPNPFQRFYASMSILVLANVVHFYTVGFLTVTTALKQLDQEFETVSESLAIPFYTTMFRVTIPVCLPAILETGLYFFVNSMATVSAVIFLYSADLPLASVAIANMDDAGDLAPAAAMGLLIVLANLTIRFAAIPLIGSVRKRTQGWIEAGKVKP
ncbi:MAG: putative 2-aminoethylphosphonate ABC transporter permease subunit [Thermodesulfobacteriota bacterium]